MLEELPGFAWDTRQARYEAGLRALTYFMRREGHAQVVTHRVERGFPLGRWVAWMRRSRRLGLLPRQIAKRLEGLPGWSWGPQQESWKEFLAHLRRFVRREGHARVPRHHWEGDYPLGLRVWTQRMCHRAGILSPAKVRLLERVRGWVWNAQQWAFEEGVRRIREYARRAPVAAVQHRYRDPRTEYGLGHRVFRLRDAYWKGRLTKAQTRTLEGIKGWSWGRRPR